MFFKKTVAYCLTILVLLVPIFISVQTAIAPIFADEVPGPEELGCGVSRQSFTYGGQTFSNWDLSSYFPDTIKNYDVDNKILRPSADEENGFCKSVNWLIGNGYKYIMIVDLYKCQYSDGTYRTKDYGVIMGFKSSVVSCTKKMANDGSFYYWLSFGDSKVEEYTYYVDYGDGSNKFSNSGFSDVVFATSYSDNTISGLSFHKSFAGMSFGSPYSVLPCYDRGYINIMSNFDPKIDGVYSDASSGIQDSLFQGVHTGTFSVTSNLSGDISKDLEKCQIGLSNGRSGSVQWLCWISSVQASGTSVSSSFQKYSWCYQTKQNVKVYRASALQDLIDTQVQTFDIWGSPFPLSIATKIPLYLLLKNVSDSKLFGLYTDSNMSCPFQYQSSGATRTINVKISDLPLSSGATYYLNVAYRDTTSQKLSGLYSTSYSNVYYDDISQLDGNYTCVLSQSFRLTESVYTAPKVNDDGYLVDDKNNVITDDNGNPLNYSNNYSNDVVGIKSGNAKSDAYATGGSASAQGGSASVINNNNPTFSNNITVGGSGGSGSGGTAQDFDDVDVSTFENLWNSCGNFFSFVKKIWATFPLQASLVSGIFVVLFVLRVARR